MLPNFLCVGAQKSGTSTFYDIIKQHPEIFMPKIKELHFFDIDENYSKGTRWYEEKFFQEADNPKYIAIGEVTPDYMFYDYVPERILKALGCETKIVFILRNPVERAYSQYLMSCARGQEKESFERGLELEEQRIDNRNLIREEYSYFNRGLYAKQIENFLRIFPRDNMMFIIFEEFIMDIEGTMEKVFEFLGVEKKIILDYNIHSNGAWKPVNKLFLSLFLGKAAIIFRRIIKKILSEKTVNFLKKYHLKVLLKLVKKPYKAKPIDPKTREMLFTRFAEDQSLLETILKRDFNLWKKTTTNSQF